MNDSGPEKLAALSADMKNVCRSLDEIKGDAKKREDKLDRLDDKIDAVLLQATRTNGRVNQLEEHRKTVCTAHSSEISDMKKRMWIFAGLMLGTGTLGGISADVLRGIFGH